MIDETGKSTNAFEAEKALDETLRDIIYHARKTLDRALNSARNKVLTLEDCDFMSQSLHYALMQVDGLTLACTRIDNLVTNEMRGITDSEETKEQEN